MSFALESLLVALRRAPTSDRLCIACTNHAGITEICFQSRLYGYATKTHRIYEHHDRVSSSKRRALSAEAEGATGNLQQVRAHIQRILSRLIALTCPCEHRNVERVAVAVGNLKGDKEDPTTAQKMSQALRKDKITEEMDGYVKNLSWYLESLTVCLGSRVNRSGTSY